MKEIILTRGKIAIVDDEDFDRVSRYKWRYIQQRPSSPGYAVTKINGKLISMSRFILNAPPNQQVDHKRTAETLNNTRENLRFCTHQQNQFNKRKYRCKNPYKGVYWETAKRKWRAGIRLNNKTINLGRYDNAKEAALAYNEAARKYFGEFAHLNVFAD